MGKHRFGTDDNNCIWISYKQIGNSWDDVSNLELEVTIDRTVETVIEYRELEALLLSLASDVKMKTQMRKIMAKLHSKIKKELLD